jgi:Zn ribbon nucleic-acid-binding protein
MKDNRCLDCNNEKSYSKLVFDNNNTIKNQVLDLKSMKIKNKRIKMKSYCSNCKSRLSSTKFFSSCKGCPECTSTKSLVEDYKIKNNIELHLKCDKCGYIYRRNTNPISRVKKLKNKFILSISQIF